MLSPDLEVDLEPSASHHILKVLRMSEGRSVTLFNGDGYEYCAKVVSAEKKTATLRVLNQQHLANCSPLTSELAIGLSKGDRIDWVIQKATELGVSVISPLFTERCEVRLTNERINKKLVSWEKIIISACEQCRRNILPHLRRPSNLSNYLASCDADMKLLLHHRSNTSLGDMVAPKSVALLVGPEGGLSDEEICQAECAGFSPIVFGKRVMRTETAPIAALSIMQYLWGDLGTDK